MKTPLIKKHREATKSPHPHTQLISTNVSPPKGNPQSIARRLSTPESAIPFAIALSVAPHALGSRCHCLHSLTTGHGMMWRLELLRFLQIFWPHETFGIQLQQNNKWSLPVSYCLPFDCNKVRLHQGFLGFVVLLITNFNLPVLLSLGVNTLNPKRVEI